MTLFKAASTVSLLTLASRITGLVRDLLMAATFGASGLTDAFNVAFRIPNLFRRLFGEARFIHTVRDGRDAASSVTTKTWGPGTVSPTRPSATR